jgi:hypothetical protein
LENLALLKEIESELLDFVKEANNFSSKNDKQKYFRKQRNIYIQKNISWIENNLAILKNNSIEEEKTNPAKIEPYLEIIKKESQLKTFRIFRFLSTYPFTEPVGRRIKFFIRDKTHAKNPIMGIGCISSPVINLKARDEHIGWLAKDRNKYEKLKNVVELSCAVAIPPYNELCMGKLIALSVLSIEMINYYKEKYNEKNSYVLISGSGLYGKNCSLFNRLRICSRKPYLYVGETKGFTHVHISPSLYTKIEKAAKLYRINFKKGGEFITNRKLKNIENVLYKMNTPYRKLLMLPLKKAVFLAPTASNYREYLLGKDEEANFMSYKLEDLFEYWKNRWMETRLRNENVINKFRSFNFGMHLCSLFNPCSSLLESSLI